MKKVKLNISLISSDEKYNLKKEGYLNELANEIIYIEDDLDKTKVKFKYDNNIFIREKEDYLIKYYFEDKKTTYGIILLKGENKKISIPIKTNIIEKNKYDLYVEYQIEKEIFKYNLKVEE